MAGVYGDILLAWPEQMTALEVYEMSPKVNGGWTVAVDQQGNKITRSILGVFQNTRGGGAKDSNGNLAKGDGMELWTAAEGIGGMFLQWRGYVYRIKDDNRWIREGGFYRYGLEKVVGNNGTESDDASWNTGASSFG